MNYAEFVEEVRLMRFAQNQYSESHDEKWRMERNIREKKVDGLINEIQSNSKTSHPNLF